MPASGSLPFLVKILRKEMLSKIPNGSMSLIDVRDLAALEIAAIENKEAKGMRCYIFSIEGRLYDPS